MTTHVLAVTDMSGSMDPLAEDVRGGFNAFIQGLKEPDDAGQTHTFRVTATVFDTRFIPLCIDTPLDNVPKMTVDNYQPAGMTALYDAVGKTITEFEAKHPTLPEGDRVSLVIQTDGANNSSKEFTAGHIREMLTNRQAQGWAVTYLGQGIDSWAQAGGMGVNSTGYVHTPATSRGTLDSYIGVTRGTLQFAGGASGQSVAAAVADQLAE